MLIAASLQKNIYHVSVLVDSALEILSLTLDCYEEFVKVPDVTQATLPVPEYAGVFGAEFLAPLPNGLIRDYDPALRQQILDISKAQAEPMVEPNGMADDIRRKSMSVIVGSIAGHETVCQRLPQLDNTSLTHPFISTLSTCASGQNAL